MQQVMLSQMERDILKRLATGRQPNIVRGYAQKTMGHLKALGFVVRKKGRWHLTDAGSQV